MNLTKHVTINVIKGQFPGITRLLVDFTETTMIVETEHGARSEPIASEFMQYMDMVLEAYSFKALTKLFVDVRKKAIVLSGIDKDDKPKEVVI